MLIPLVNLDKPPTEAELFRLAHLAIPSPYLLLCVPEASRTSAGSIAHKALLSHLRVCVGPFVPSEVEGAAMWLDGGAEYVLFDCDVTSGESVAQLAGALSTLPGHRAMVRLVGAPLPVGGGGAGQESPPAALEAGLSALKDVGVSAFLLPSEGPTLSLPLAKALRSACGGTSRLILLPAPHSGLTPTAVGRLAREEVDVVFPATVGAGAGEVEGSMLCLGATLAECIRTDREDGLFTTVVTDECGKVLGLVYSSRESIVLALRERRGIYYSRSRKNIWRKGDTSGNVQELLRVQLDCDCDALLFTMKQKGAMRAFCHLNTTSCWGEERGFSALERTLESRKVDAPVGSYTKRLFNDPELLRNKLLEEAQELAEAVEPEDIAAEAADLIYFALVACTKAGVTIQDVERHLDKRSLKIRRRAGDSKASRIEAAAAHFKAVEEAAKARAAAAAAAAAAPPVAVEGGSGGGGGGGGGDNPQ